MSKYLNRGLSATILASFFWSLQAIFFRGIGTGFGTFYPFVVRGLLLAVIFATYLHLSKTYKRIKKEDYKWFILMPTVGFASFSSMFVSLNKLSVGTVLFLHYAGVAVAGFVLGYLFFREKISRMKLVALLLSLTGLFVIFAAPSLKVDIPYLILACASGVGSSLWYLFSKKISSNYSYVQILTVDAVVLFFLASIFVVSFNETFYMPEFSVQWMSIVGMTLATLVGSILVVYGFKFLQAQIASLILLLEVPFGVILAWILFSEIPNGQALIGGGLILAGIAMSNFIKEESS